MKFFFPPTNSEESLDGILYLGSRSLIFEPEDKSYKIARFPFKNFIYLPFLTPMNCALNFSTSRIVEIPGNFTQPYTIYDHPEKDEKKQQVSIIFKYEKVEVASKIISELIEKFKNKNSSFEFDSVEYLGTLYSFKFDLTLIKSVTEKFIYDK
mgnify:CR=1 FL=1